MAYVMMIVRISRLTLFLASTTFTGVAPAFSQDAPKDRPPPVDMPVEATGFARAASLHLQSRNVVIGA